MKSLRAVVWFFRTGTERPETVLNLLMRAQKYHDDDLGRGFWFRSGYNTGYAQALADNHLPIPEVLPLAPVTAPIAVVAVQKAPRRIAGFHRRGDSGAAG